jgi:hypothetical protein
VNVEYSTGSTACAGGGGNTITLTFQTELGDVPILAAVTSSLGGTGTMTLVEKTRGTKEVDFCSNHGVCDYDDGRCLCHKGYTSSDGDGNAGSRNDCGFRTMFARKDAAFHRYQGGIASSITQITSFDPNTNANI